VGVDAEGGILSCRHKKNQPINHIMTARLSDWFLSHEEARTQRTWGSMPHSHCNVDLFCHRGHTTDTAKTSSS
jgi:hypothetical protein